MPATGPHSRSRSLSRERLLEADESDLPLQTFEDNHHLANDIPTVYDGAPPGFAAATQSQPQAGQLFELPFLPSSLRIPLMGVSRWIQGPGQPRRFRITPLFDSLQRTLDLQWTWRGWPIKSSLLCLVLVACSLSMLSDIVRSSHKCNIPGYGEATRLSCISRLWPDSTKCGVDGQNCRPFHDRRFAFVCPADCEGTKVWNPRFIGNVEVNYRPLVVGGPRPNGSVAYRGDSFICGAARHAGIIDNVHGGAGVATLIGEQSHYPSVDANGISSIGFEPSFPQSFNFEDLPDELNMQLRSRCGDFRWSVLVASLIFMSVASTLASSPAVFFWTNFVYVFFCVALVMDPPNAENVGEVVSSAFSRFLPAAFVAIVIYRHCVRRTLLGFTGHVEKTVLWLGPYWVGALNRYTFDQLPIQRLTPHDLRSQPGAITVLVLLILILLAVGLGQAWAFRVEGRLLRYLAFYAIVVMGLLILVAIPGLSLRLHHYIIALLLLPGTAIQTRPSLVYQGLLVGLFVSGVARWGFASILETSATLIADGPVGGALPQVAVPVISGDKITFTWANLTQAASLASKLKDGFDSINILINDVERFRGIEDHNPDSFTWTRHRPGEVEFFRMAFVKFGQASRDVVFDYTRPATWFVNGTWVHFGS